MSICAWKSSCGNWCWFRPEPKCPGVEQAAKCMPGSQPLAICEAQRTQMKTGVYTP